MADQRARLDMLPAVTAAQMREVDRIVVEDFGISLLQMMENAGRALAELTRIQLSGVRGRPVCQHARHPDPRPRPTVSPGSQSRATSRPNAPRRATRTLPLALQKVGLLRPEAASSVGELWLADISVPPQAYAGFGIDPGRLFAESDLVRFTRD